METFTFHGDCAHGWLEVSKEKLKKLAKHLIKDISNYSYMDENNVYLEEDCDMSKFLRYLEANKITFRILDKYTETYSEIRHKEKFKNYII